VNENKISGLSVNADPPKAHAALVIDAQKNGNMLLFDPINVDQTHSGSGTYGFNMTVKGSGGQFFWGGENIFDVDNPSADYKSITLEDGSKTWLPGGYMPSLSTEDVPVIFTLKAPKFDFNLSSGAWMEIGGSNVMTLTNAKLAGTLNFDLEGTRWMDQQDAISSGLEHFLLTVKNTDGGKTDISGSLIGLTDLTSNNPITEGAKVFQLIATEKPGDLIGDPAGKGLEAEYNTTVPYYAAHVGLARAWALNERRRLDVTGRYFWARQVGNGAVLPNGEIAEFDADDSHRVRLGSRLTFVCDDHREWYLGVASEYEFAGESHGSANGYAFDFPTLDGFTGIGELGWVYRPTKDNAFSFETGIHGYIGRMRGISGGVKMEWRF
jgi:hypothetical protein